MNQTSRHPRLLDAADVALLVIDVQEKFRAVMQGFDDMVEGCIKLVKTFQHLELPIWVTEQYPKGLGETVPELKAVLDAAPPLEKTAFSSYGCKGIPELITESRARSILICGIETHVCVNQTVHDLLAAGYRVHVAVDAIESRHAINREIALKKMEQSGAVLTTTEMAAFELLVDAKNKKFKEVQALYK